MIGKWIKRHWLLLLAISAVLYLVIGAAAPFFRHQTITPATEAAFSADSFYAEGSGVDRAMLLETNESAWEERLRLMNLARERIILSTFDLRDGESPRDLLSVLLHKAEEGVQVKILVDGFSGLVHMEHNKLFYALSSHPNVEIKLYNPINLLTPWTTQGRMHDKYVIVDDIGYLLGGRNTFDYFIGSYPTDSRSHDREVLVYNTAHGTGRSRDSSLTQVEQYFQGVWNLDVCRLFHDEEALASGESVLQETEILHQRYLGLKEAQPALLGSAEAALAFYQAQTCETGQITLVSNPTGIYGKEPTVFYTLTQLMKQASRYVDIHTPYAVFNQSMYDTMSQVQDRIPVRMMINSVENGDNFFASSDYLRHRKSLADTGISILEYDGGTSYHGKSMVIDGKLAIIGSYNFDLRSTYMDTELMLVIHSPRLAGELERLMASYEQDCRLLLPDGSYQIPDHLTPAPVPVWKRAAWAVVGLVMQPFRFLI